MYEYFPKTFFSEQPFKRLSPRLFKEMRPAPKPTSLAPSVTVLRFLRSQSEQACFFTPSTRATTCPNSPSRSAKGAPGKVAHAQPSFRRNLVTTSRCQAYVESSLLNLDFLRPDSERASSSSAALASRNSPTRIGFPPENTKFSRYASTDTRPQWRKPWKDKWRTEKVASKSSDSLTPPSFLDDAGSTSLGRRKITKGANELRLRCTEFDENGNVNFMDGEFKKSELIAKVCSLSSMPKSRGRG